MTCTNCTNELDANDVFCGSCGTKVLVATSPAVPVVPGEVQPANPTVPASQTLTEQITPSLPPMQPPQSQPPMPPQA